MAVATEETAKRKGGSRPQSPAQRALSQFARVEKELAALEELAPGKLEEVKSALDEVFVTIVQAARGR